MAFGVQAYTSSGAPQWNTMTATSGVVGDYRKYAAHATGETISYPQWAGLTAVLIDCGGAREAVTLSTSSGYPVITVTPPDADMAFSLMVY